MESTKCLNCGKEVTQKKGKRAKLYCSDLCRATFHQKKKPEPDFIKVSVEEHQKMVVVVEDENGTWEMDGKKVRLDWADKQDKVEVNLKFPKTITYYDKEVSVLVGDKEIPIPENSNQELITKYETELSTLGDGQFAKARKKWLTNKIKELTQQLNQLKQS